MKHLEGPTVIFAFNAFSLGVVDFAEVKKLFEFFVCYVGEYSFNCKYYNLKKLQSQCTSEGAVHRNRAITNNYGKKTLKC